MPCLYLIYINHYLENKAHYLGNGEEININPVKAFLELLLFHCNNIAQIIFIYL